jgi:hypothetical protein
LQKIITGGVLLAISFLMTGGIELALEKTYAHPPGPSRDREGYSSAREGSDSPI